jgi:shikimate dehydrogenase
MPENVVNASTGVYAILGDPISHSLSPVIMNRMFSRLGLDKVFLAFRVAADSFERVFPVLKSLGLEGYVLTMPVKERAAPLLDGLEAEAEITGAVNCVAVREGRLIGHNTDSLGFWRAALERTGGSAPGEVFILGSGGFAKAAACQAALRGAKRVTAAFRRSETALAAGFRRFGERLGSRFPGVEIACLDWRPETWGGSLAAADLIVNATPNGMGGIGDLGRIFPYGAAKPGALFFDAVYHPLETEFLRRAGERGHPIADGLDLLGHQGAESFRLWTGAEADPAAMRADALGFLRERGR